MLTAQSLPAAGDSRFPDRSPVSLLESSWIEGRMSLAKVIMYQALEHNMQ
jgi:hypothetical protein